MSSNPRALVVGDLMLDEFNYGSVERISPEAATPVLLSRRTALMIGGAGNVGRGIAALDCGCDLVGLIGNDAIGRKLMREFRPHAGGLDGGLLTPHLVLDTNRVTTHKLRYVSEQHSTHLLRVDNEDTTDISDLMESLVLNRATQLLHEAATRVLVLSDYCKGVLTPTIVEELIKTARDLDIPVIVDSKRSALDMFRGASVVKQNLAELGCKESEGDAKIASAAQAVMECFGFQSMVITRGENGLSFVHRCGNYEHIPGKRVRVRDVSGAGDTVVAVLAVMRARGLPMTRALKAANRAAAIAVGKPGTSVVTSAEINTGGKIDDPTQTLLDQRMREWRGQRIGFANGCFDLLHSGHVSLLTQARAHCDKLIVGLNSDDSVRRLKGDKRPVQSQAERATVLAALDAVDLVVIFEQDTPTALCERIRPHTIFKGDDYLPGEVAGQEYATAVHIVPKVSTVSTTSTIERMARDLQRPMAGRCDVQCLACQESGDFNPDTCARILTYAAKSKVSDWCEQCQGPCARRPRHGETGL